MIWVVLVLIVGSLLAWLLIALLPISTVDPDPYPEWDGHPAPKSSAFLRREAAWNRRHDCHAFADSLDAYADMMDSRS